MEISFLNSGLDLGLEFKSLSVFFSFWCYDRAMLPVAPSNDLSVSLPSAMWLCSLHPLWFWDVWLAMADGTGANWSTDLQKFICFLPHLQLLLPLCEKTWVSSWRMRGTWSWVIPTGGILNQLALSWLARHMSEPAQISRMVQPSINSRANRNIYFYTPLGFCGCLLCNNIVAIDSWHWHRMWVPSECSYP